MESVLKRDTSFDSIKYVLIAFVVWGHTMHFGHYGFNKVLFSFINSFHMPAFVIISGYFYKNKESKAFWKDIIELLLVVALFQILYFSTGWNGPLDFTLSGILDRIIKLLYPSRALWYLMSLCFWRIMIKHTPPQLIDNKRVMMLLTLVMSVVAAFIPINVFSFQRTFFFFPLFVLGFYMSKSDVWKRIRGLNKWVCVSIIFAYIVFIQLVIYKLSFFPDNLLAGRYSRFGHFNWVVTPVLRCLMYLYFLPLTVCVLSIIPDLPFFHNNGKNTMFYLLYHPFFILALAQIQKYYEIPTSPIAIFFYMIANMFIMYWLNKINILRFLTRPISMIRKQESIKK